jgi:glycerophosphoryl diester phosphodiesterase
VRIIAHRGLCRSHKENTIDAFRAALDAGVRELETDIRETPQGELVLMHDETLERVAGASAGVRDGLEAMREHHPVATLEELVAILPPDALLHLDLKACDPGRLARAAAALERRTVASADEGLLRAVKRAAPDLAYGFQPRERPIPEALELAREFEATSWRLNIDRLDRKWFDAAGDAKLEIFVYPVDTPEAVARMRALGVDAVFTRYPDMES